MGWNWKAAERKEGLKHIAHPKGWKQWRNRPIPAKGGSVIILLKISIYLHSDVRCLTIIWSELQGSYQCGKRSNSENSSEKKKKKNV